MTSVPEPTFGPNGFILPAQADILAGVEADIDTAFGGGLNFDQTTPQGQIAVSQTAVISDKNNQFLFLSQMFDPNYSEGIYQDAIARIYFLERNPAQPTVVQALCSGGNGVVIPAGALAQATDGNLYTCTTPGTITGGSVVLPFACQVTGPIACPAGTLTTIYQTIPGWDTITNAADGVLGNNVESRAAFEYRREQSVALNSIGSLPSILGSVLAVPNVLDAYVTENTSAVTQTIGGVSLAPNSLYVAVVGGNSLAIATAIWQKKAPGCAYNGNTTVTVTDNNSGYNTPAPTYQVTFEIPTAVDIMFAVVIKNSAAVPSNYVALIQNAIISAFAGGDGGPRARIGSEIFASRFYSTVAALGTWAQIVSILIGTSSATLNDLTLNINQVPTVSAGDITVTTGA
jgi:hypothetical protein